MEGKEVFVMNDQDVMKAIFRVMGPGKPGSGFLLRDQQHILTALHVVGPQSDDIIVYDMDANNYRATVQKRNVTLDIALLRLDKPLENIKPLNLFENSVSAGTKVRTWGHPTESGDHWHSGKIPGSTRNQGYDVEFNALTDYSSLAGLSGSPVFLEDDNSYSVIGIITKQNPSNPQKGEISSSASFFEEINRVFLTEVPPEQTPWCYIILSEAETSCESGWTLRTAVGMALWWLQNKSSDLEELSILKEDLEPGRIKYISAIEIVSSQASYEESVRNLCHAKVVIFDLTNLEPAIMLLLGIRSVVRRGVTIVSRGKEKSADYPFNIKEVNILSHSEGRPGELIHKEMLEGFRQLRDNKTQYLDLPTFDAVRNLPPGSRGLDTYNVFLLCSYSNVYQDENWNPVKDYVDRILIQDQTKKTPPNLLRNMDTPSPRLISHMLYQAIRLKALCLVDWTGWRPNVFFEFGVRLAITDKSKYTISILDRNKNQERTPQQNNLISLFEPLYYTPQPSSPADLNIFKDMLYYYPSNKEKKQQPPPSKSGLSSYATYDIIQEIIDVSEETIAAPVYEELYQKACLFDILDEEGRKAVLYPENKNLKHSVEKGVVERLLAAWYFIQEEYVDAEILNDRELHAYAIRISMQLQKHIQYDDRRTQLQARLENFIERLSK